jgi:hypothetical protein
MSSEINYQAVDVQQLCVPEIIHVNSVPSLLPKAGALAFSKANPSEVYFADGTSWNTIAQSNGVVGFAYAASVSLAGAGGNPNLSNCALWMQSVQVRTGQTLNMVSFILSIDQSITTVGTGSWTSVAGAIPAGYCPLSTIYLAGAIGTLAGIINNVWRIEPNGTIVINFDGTPGTNTTFTSFCCNYRVAAI